MLRCSSRSAPSLGGDETQSQKQLPSNSFRNGDQRAASTNAPSQPLSQNGVLGYMIARQFSMQSSGRMSLALFESPNSSFFVTSDNPCVWFNPYAYRMPPMYRSAALAMKDIEITMPISPKILAVATHNGMMTGYHRLTDTKVNELNRRTVGSCDQQFVSRSPDILPIWFDPGKVPDDAWENRAKADARPPHNPFEK